MAELKEVQALVLSKRKYKERDYLVKIFLNHYGKMMFYVRGSKNPNRSMAGLIRPFTAGRYIVDIRKTGLSFIRDAKSVQAFSQIQQDIFKNAYATYICGLVDACMEDRQPADGLFRQLYYGLSKIEADIDPEVIMFIFEIKLLYYFGVMPDFFTCQFCGRSQGPFDYSGAYAGLLCPNHLDQDAHRLQLHPKTIYHVQNFLQVNLKNIESITIAPEIKASLEKLTNTIYEDVVGVHLKSKKFIKQMKKWGSMLDGDWLFLVI